MPEEMHYALTYTYAADYMERRAPLRKEHLALAWAAHERGEFMLGGVFEDPLDGALFVFRGESPAAAHAFVAADPYVRHGLVTGWRVRPWRTVVGTEAAHPIHPDMT